ncbi:MAG: hypothetical protein EWM45_06890 [Rhodopseudomonas palustris]|uniref:integrase core domain-containing protein n=1 Tax=Rhodopseudomonas faecalis TaxID=99655 RepID=UPI0011B7D581|nr:MAG: hypothetical protein EWM45_06890 [Rhodopseudomonas palustris]
MPAHDSTACCSPLRRRSSVGRWRADYNQTHPHSRLGWRTPAEFAFTHPRRDLVLRYAEGCAPAPAAPPAQQGNSTARTELAAG